jgi:hypothetical protein
VHKNLVPPTPAAEKKPRKHKPKEDETSTDTDIDEEAPSSELSGDEGSEEATEQFATIIHGPPTVTGSDGGEAAGKN